MNIKDLSIADLKVATGFMQSLINSYLHDEVAKQPKFDKEHDEKYIDYKLLKSFIDKELTNKVLSLKK